MLLNLGRARRNPHPTMWSWPPCLKNFLLFQFFQSTLVRMYNYCSSIWTANCEISTNIYTLPLQLDCQSLRWYWWSCLFVIFLNLLFGNRNNLLACMWSGLDAKTCHSAEMNWEVIISTLHPSVTCYCSQKGGLRKWTNKHCYCLFDCCICLFVVWEFIHFGEDRLPLAS